MIRRIAMWSGPRNISTALMRSWEARGDTLVIDEPLYAHYLQQTGLDHPGADRVIACGETDLQAVVRQLTSEQPADARHSIVYQKHMAHHLLDGISTEWVDDLSNALLIREPAEMLSSLLRVIPNPDIEATGLPAQVMLQERSGNRLPILEARGVLESPRRALRALCGSLGVPFKEQMLRWPPGRRPTDGVWAEYWYASVERSTEFSSYEPRPVAIPRRHLSLLKECETLYAKLAPPADSLAPEE